MTLARTKLDEGLAPRSCPVCATGEEGRVFLEARYDTAKLDEFAFSSRKAPEFMHFRLVRCPHCDVLYASPAPSAASLASNYEEAAYDSATEAEYAARTYGRYLGEILRELPRRETALDIGTGNGAFLAELLKAGFRSVEGVEPSRSAIAAAAADIRPRIRHGTFRPEDFQPQSTSLVSCFMTLEHVSDPGKLCRAIAQVLEPGGAALFVAHDYLSWHARLMKERSPIYDIEHMQLFSRASLAYLLRDAGFERVRVVPIVNRYPLGYWLRLLPIPRGLKDQLARALRVTGLHSVSVPMSVGNVAAWGFRPGVPPAGG